MLCCFERYARLKKEHNIIGAEVTKEAFGEELKRFVTSLNSYVSTPDGQWTIKGFIDVYRRIYTISSDTKIVSKLLEIHLFPNLLKFGEDNGYRLLPAEKQNYYPDMSFVSHSGQTKFAVDFKTTYRLPNNPGVLQRIHARLTWQLLRGQEQA